MVCEMEQVLRVYDGFLYSMSVTSDDDVVAQASYFVCASYFDRKPMQ